MCVRCVCEASPQVGHEVSSAVGGRRPEDLRHKHTVMSSETLIRTKDIECFMFNIHQTVSVSPSSRVSLLVLFLFFFLPCTQTNTQQPLNS